MLREREMKSTEKFLDLNPSPLNTSQKLLPLSYSAHGRGAGHRLHVVALCGGLSRIPCYWFYLSKWLDCIAGGGGGGPPAPLPLSQWLSGKSIWLVFRRSWVQIPAGPGVFFCGLKFLSLGIAITKWAYWLFSNNQPTQCSWVPITITRLVGTHFPLYRKLNQKWGWALLEVWALS